MLVNDGDGIKKPNPQTIVHFLLNVTVLGQRRLCFASCSAYIYTLRSSVHPYAG